MAAWRTLTGRSWIVLGLSHVLMEPGVVGPSLGRFILATCFLKSAPIGFVGLVHQPLRQNVIPLALPALTRAAKIGKRAAQVGFEWPDVLGALDKVSEELDELRRELAGHDVDNGMDSSAVEQEMGDVLFSLVNVCRYLRVDPERASRATKPIRNSKGLSRRFS